MIARALLVAAALLVAGEARAYKAGQFCDCATDSGTTVGEYKDAACEAIGVPKFAGEFLQCEDAEWDEYVDLEGPNSLTDPDFFGFTDCRGAGSLLGQRYGANNAAMGWTSGNPASPTYGAACGSAPGHCGSACMPSVWLEGDPLQAGSTYGFAIFTTGVADDIFDGATLPAGPLAGSRSLAEVVHAGSVHGLWTGGTLTFDDYTFAISKILAYPDNLASSGIMVEPWKGDQCGVNAHCVESWLAEGDASDFPFEGPLIYSLDDCAGAISGATFVVGSSADLDCGGAGVNLRFTDPANYLQSVDFPFGSKGLLQTIFVAMGTENSEVAVLFYPEGATDPKVLFYVMDLDTRGFEAMDVYNPNPFPNANQTNGEVTCAARGTCTTLDTGRVFDNLFIQAWSSGTSPADAAAVIALLPVPSTIQFGEGGGEPEPSGVTRLRGGSLRGAAAR